MSTSFNFLIDFSAQYAYMRFDTTPHKESNWRSVPIHYLLKIIPSAPSRYLLSADSVEKRLGQSIKKNGGLLKTVINYLFNLAIQNDIIRQPRPYEFTITFIECLSLKSKATAVLVASNVCPAFPGSNSLITYTSREARKVNRLWHLLCQKIACIRFNQNDLKNVHEYALLIPDRLLGKINEYHRIPKTKYEYLNPRMEKLLDICKECLLSAQSISKFSTLRDLFICSAGKYNYLNCLFYSLKFFQKKNLFKSFIERFLTPPSRTHLISRHMPNAFHYRQIFDPYMSDSQEIHDFFKKWKENPLCENRPPFLLWLEQFNRSDQPNNRIQTPQELECLKLQFRDSLIYQNGVLLNVERADFVVDFKGNFYVSKEIKHIGFFNGKLVTGAGEVTVVNGKITLINDNSGHYQPRIIHTLQTLKLLTRFDVFVSDAIVSYIDTQKIIDQVSPCYTRVSVNDFLEHPPFEPDGIISVFTKGKVELYQLGKNQKYFQKWSPHENTHS